MVRYHITPEKIPNRGILFIDHESEFRTGHLSHALVEYAPGKVLAFYADCAGNRNDGHNGFGWVGYRRSTDGARTWGDPTPLPYSLNAFLNEPFMVVCEKAVSVKENEIYLFCTRFAGDTGWDDTITPVILRSTDGGETWEERGELCPYAGRVYDALVHDGTIYVLQQANPGFFVTAPEHKYRVFASDDGGSTFSERGTLPGELRNHAYGTMELTPDEKLIVYLYNGSDEFRLSTFVSADRGNTWTDNGQSYCAKRIRNPQVTRVRGGYVLHGRSGCKSDDLPMEFVLYTSEDGMHWDDGVYIGYGQKPWGGACCFYSNNLVLNEGDSQRVLIQSSVTYYAARTNVAHWFLDIES